MTERAALERGVGEEGAREARPEWGGSVCALAEGPRRLWGGASTLQAAPWDGGTVL